jgi:nucleotide-binding universal stress UspA family protein
VAIGWNASREAARALFDSLPVLKRAKAVHFIWVDPPGEGWGKEVIASLALRGVHATAESVTAGGKTAGEALLERAKTLGAGLLVIGAYGHSRLTEFILGGVTRTVLRRMKCPVLLSH